MPDEVVTTPRAQSHLPAAYAVCRNLLSEEEIERACKLLAKPIDTPPAHGEPFLVHKYSKALPTLMKAWPSLFERVNALSGSFGRYLQLDTDEVESIKVRDVRCTRLFEGHECPWQRDDPTSHFIVHILLSEPGLQFDGGRLMVHAGECTADTDAMPVSLSRGDAVIYSAPRLDHAIQRVTEGERTACVLELIASECERPGSAMMAGALPPVPPAITGPAVMAPAMAPAMDPAIE